ncbi:hypothetical protein [Halodesulfovibrio marinisediminis]|uniref:Uncharacterized protein n=1 Tax=Halodesulfovibrio marinisediminis DSM 17456 TaxID=1121457 RepID=A0A1N6I090_9BACT|nr:hypothetical protein [Halodesulfovibrio marinisediminis]SIO25349.1 hypothetical protein SAMN02745161_2311 [Halodesulfovibrio marinisediminis DSM 17456]
MIQYDLCVKPAVVTEELSIFSELGVNYQGVEAHDEAEARKMVLESFQKMFGCPGVVVECLHVVVEDVVMQPRRR